MYVRLCVSVYVHIHTDTDTHTVDGRHEQFVLHVQEKLLIFVYGERSRIQDGFKVDTQCW